MGLERFLRTGVLHSKKAVHGGNVWEFVEGGFLGKSADVIDFSSNINPLGPSKEALEAMRNSLWKLSHYPEAQAEPLKKELSKYLEVKKENLTCGNGSAELIRNFCDAFLGRSDRALVCGPTFSEYEVYTKLYGAEVKYLLAEPPKFSLSVEDIVERIDGKIKAMFICNPNNPTGTAMDKKELRVVIEHALDRDCLVLLDEAYIEFSNDEGFTKKVEEFENLLVVRSLTKFFALAGARAGYGVGSEEMVSSLDKLSPPWSVNSIAQVAAVHSLRDEEYIRRTKEFVEREKKFLFKALKRVEGLNVFKSDANFFMMEIERRMTAAEMQETLLRQGLLIRDCSSFHGLDERFFRVCVRKREENVALIDAIREVLEEGDA